MRGLAKTANIITRSDSYNLTSTEPLVSLFTQMIEAVDSPQGKRSLASLSGLVEVDGAWHRAHPRAHQCGAAQQRIPRVRATSPGRATYERQALARIVEMIETTPAATVNFETLELETATAIRQFALIAADPEAHRPRHADPLPHRGVRKPGNRADRGLLRQAVWCQRYRRHLAAVRNAARASRVARGLSSDSWKRTPTRTT